MGGTAILHHHQHVGTLHSFHRFPDIIECLKLDHFRHECIKVDSVQLIVAAGEVQFHTEVETHEVRDIV